jgi:hypothetical protein
MQFEQQREFAEATDIHCHGVADSGTWLPPVLPGGLAAKDFERCRAGLRELNERAIRLVGSRRNP